jgi:hypothetical protein
MNRSDLINLHSELCGKAGQILAAKNADYGDPEDCFGNLRLCEQMRVCSMEQGILIRMADKIRRAANMLSREALVKEESIEDNLLDTINYCVLAVAALRDRKNT